MQKELQNELENIFYLYPNLFYNTISEFYPLNEELIEVFSDRINWVLIQYNQNIIWTDKIVLKYFDKIDFTLLNINKESIIDKVNNEFVNWKMLSKSNKLNWSITFISKHIEYWDWIELSRNFHLPWSIELIKEFDNKWDWKSLSGFKNSYYDYKWHEDGRVANIVFTVEILENYKDYWDWGIISTVVNLPWTEDLIRKFDNKWEWKYLRNNKAIPWSIELVKDYFYLLFEQGTFSNFLLLKSEIKTVWSIKFIKEFVPYWHWNLLTENKSIVFDKKMLFTFQEKWNWKYLCSSNTINWDFDLIQLFESRINWLSFSANNSVFWSYKILYSYKTKILWKTVCRLGTIPCQRDILTDFNEFLDWEELSYNQNIKWSKELLIEFKDNLNWEGITNNPNILWTHDMILQFETVINFKSYNFAKNGFWPLYTDILIKHKNEISGKGLSENNLIWSSYKYSNLINQLKNKLDWNSLTQNRSFIRYSSIVETYFDKLNWNKLLENNFFSIQINIDFILKNSYYILNALNQKDEYYKLPNSITKTISEHLSSSNIEYYNRILTSKNVKKINKYNLATCESLINNNVLLTSNLFIDNSNKKFVRTSIVDIDFINFERKYNAHEEVYKYYAIVTLNLSISKKDKILANANKSVNSFDKAISCLNMLKISCLIEDAENLYVNQNVIAEISYNKLTRNFDLLEITSRFTTIIKNGLIN